MAKRSSVCLSPAAHFSSAAAQCSSYLHQLYSLSHTLSASLLLFPASVVLDNNDMDTLSLSFSLSCISTSSYILTFWGHFHVLDVCKPNMSHFPTQLKLVLFSNAVSAAGQQVKQHRKANEQKRTVMLISLWSLYV